MTAQAFDLTERLQTPVIVMTDLDLGMNDHVTDPLQWDDNRRVDRGKILTSAQLDRIYKLIANGNGGAYSESNGNADTPLPLTGNVGAVEGVNDIEAFDPPEEGRHEVGGAEIEQFEGKYGRYLDIDGDGVPYRTLPGTHSTRGAFVTRGSSRDEYAVYTEDGDAYRRNVDRLARKWETAAELVPPPQFFQDSNKQADGVIFFGTSSYAAKEATDLLAEEGIRLDAMRPRAFPFGREFREFVEAHDRVFVIEQNRDAQFRSLMMIELGTDPAKLVSVLNYDGMPITADYIYRLIKGNIQKQ